MGRNKPKEIPMTNQPKREYGQPDFRGKDAIKTLEKLAKIMSKPQEESKESPFVDGEYREHQLIINPNEKKAMEKMGIDTSKMNVTKNVYSKPPQTWKETPEFKLAVRFADELLDEPYADPDDHPRTVARQFIRMIDRYEDLEKIIETEREKAYKEGLETALEIFKKAQSKKALSDWFKKGLADIDDYIKKDSV